MLCLSGLMYLFVGETCATVSAHLDVLLGIVTRFISVRRQLASLTRLACVTSVCWY